jgi:hypothetical protein
MRRAIVAQASAEIKPVGICPSLNSVPWHSKCPLLGIALEITYLTITAAIYALIQVE